MSIETVANNVPRTILVVDNFEPILEVADTYLESEGYAVFTATSGIGALRVAQQYPGVIDVLLTEERLPDMNGTVLAARMKLYRPALAVIVMSAALQGRTYQEYEAQHGALFLWKPFSKSELMLKVSTALQEKAGAAVAGTREGGGAGPSVV